MLVSTLAYINYYPIRQADRLTDRQTDTCTYRKHIARVINACAYIYITLGAKEISTQVGAFLVFLLWKYV